jgi:hypothetical protein
MNYISTIHVSTNQTAQKILDLGRIIVDVIKSLEYIPNDIQLDFRYENRQGYLDISSTMSADTKLVIMRMSDWSNH